MNSIAFALQPETDVRTIHGLAELMSRAFRGEDLDPLGAELLERAHQDDPLALMDLAILLQLRGNEETGVAVQQQALQIQQHYPVYRHPGQQRLRLLAIAGPGNLMTNTPLEFIAKGAGFELDILYIVPGQPFPAAFPEHDIAIVAMSELDRNQYALELCQTFVDRWPRPLLNMPAKVMPLARDMICHQLQSCSQIEIPVTERLDYKTLCRAIAGYPPLDELLGDGKLPMIIRPTDSHAGKGLAKIDHAQALADYLADYSPEQSFFVSRFVDYSNQDGLFRKYRIAMIDGEPQLAHMAVSDHWMIHYLNAGMDENAAKRAEEARAMAEFNQGFAVRHREAFKQLQQVVGLDYFGIDCSESQDGRLLIFEVGASLNIHDMDDPERYPYKSPQMRYIFAEFEAFLKRRILQAPASCVLKQAS